MWDEVKAKPIEVEYTINPEDEALKTMPDRIVVTEEIEVPGDTENTDTSIPRKEIVKKVIRPTQKQKKMIDLFLDEKSPTFGNKTESYIKAYNNKNPNRSTQHTTAVQAFKAPQASQYLQAVLHQNNCTIQDRAAQLSRILDGRFTSETTYLDAAQEVKGKTVQGVTPSQALKAIDLLNKMDGTYTKREVEKEIAKDEYREFRKQQLRKMRNTLPPQRTVQPTEEPTDSIESPEVPEPQNA